MAATGLGDYAFEPGVDILSGVVSLNAETQRGQQRHQIISSPWHTYTYGKTNYISWCCFCFKLFAPRMKMVVVWHYRIHIYFPTTVCTFNIKCLRFLGFPVATSQCGNRQVSVCVRMCKCTNVHTLVTIGCFNISCIIYLHACLCHTLSIIISSKHTIYMDGQHYLAL